MLETSYIVAYFVFGLISILTMTIIVIWFERLWILHLRRFCCNILSDNIFIHYRNNSVDIDTGTETCTEVDDNEYKENIDVNILYANGIIDIEIGSVMRNKECDEEVKDLDV